MQLVQYVTEVAKPNQKRLTEFQDANLASLEFRMFSRAPIYTDMDEMLFADGLQESLDQLGRMIPLSNRSWRARTCGCCERINCGAKLGDVDFRKALVKGGEKAVAESTDPLIVLARKIDPEARETAMDRNEFEQRPIRRGGKNWQSPIRRLRKKYIS